MILEREFELWLDNYWPLWKQHKGSIRWHDLRLAFLAGFKVGDEGPSAQNVAEIVPQQVSALEFISSKSRDFVPPKRKRPT